MVLNSTDRIMIKGAVIELNCVTRIMKIEKIATKKAEERYS